jgi:hypothetical protein
MRSLGRGPSLAALERDAESFDDGGRGYDARCLHSEVSDEGISE